MEIFKTDKAGIPAQIKEDIHKSVANYKRDFGIPNVILMNPRDADIYKKSLFKTPPPDFDKMSIFFEGILVYRSLDVKPGYYIIAQS